MNLKIKRIRKKKYSTDEINDLLDRQIRLCSNQFIHNNMGKETAKIMVLATPRVLS